MKKLLILSICAFSIFEGIALGQEKVEIPTAAKTAFASKFPKAYQVKWSIEKPGEYEAEYKLNNIESSALFDTKGSLLETEFEIKESNLPQAVKASIAKSFAGYKLDEIEKNTNAKGVVSYEMEAAKGKTKIEISFDATGKLLKKEVVKDKSKKSKD